MRDADNSKKTARLNISYFQSCRLPIRINWQSEFSTIGMMILSGCITSDPVVIWGFLITTKRMNQRILTVIPGDIYQAAGCLGRNKLPSRGSLLPGHWSRQSHTHNSGVKIMENNGPFHLKRPYASRVAGVSSERLLTIINPTIHKSMTKQPGRLRWPIIVWSVFRVRELMNEKKAK